MRGMFLGPQRGDGDRFAEEERGATFKDSVSTDTAIWTPG